MKHQYKQAAVTALLGLAIAGTAQAGGDTALCAAPGVELLTDNTGDVDGAGLLPVGLPLSMYDIESAHLAQVDGGDKLTFTLKVSSLSALPPSSAWFISFKAPDNQIRGVRLITDITGAESFVSYTGGANNDGGVDGRFVDSSKPAEGSYTADGTIVITVPASDIGVKKEGDIISQFNAGTVLTIGTADVAALGVVPDAAPDDLGRRGSVTTVSSAECTGSATKSGLLGSSHTNRFGGSLGLGLLLPFALFGLRRRTR